MKSKTIWIIIGIVILLALLYWGSQTNWWGLKTSTSTTPTAAVLGLTKRLVAPLSGQQSDYSAINLVTGKPIWIWSGGLPCPDGYLKATRNEDAGWCQLINMQTI